MNEEVKGVDFADVKPEGDGARVELEALLKELMPVEKQNASVEEMALEYIKEQKAMNDRLVEALGDDPRMAQALAEMMHGGKGAASIVRYFGKSFLDAEEGSPEYEEVMKADKEFLDNKAKAEKNLQDFDNKAAEFFKAFVAYCERKNLNADVYKMRILDELMIPVMDWVATDEVFDRLVNAVDYNKDVEDAFQAGEVKGRNMNINELRARPSDGLPGGLGSHGVPVQNEIPRKRNSLIAAALEA